MKIYLVWDDYDYYGPDPADPPWIFDTEAKARARIDEIVDAQNRPDWTWGAFNQPRGRGFHYYEEVEVS